MQIRRSALELQTFYLAELCWESGPKRVRVP